MKTTFEMVDHQHTFYYSIAGSLLEERNRQAIIWIDIRHWFNMELSLLVGDSGLSLT